MARKILTKVDFCGIASENFALETLTGSAAVKTDGGSLYIDGRNGVAYPNKVHYVAFDKIGANDPALANFTVASEEWVNNTFGQSFGAHLSNTTIHITADERKKWNGKQDSISDLSDIRDNANSGATAHGWGNHASAGYDKLAIYDELQDVDVVNTVSTAPRDGMGSVDDKVLVFSSNKGFLWFSAKNKAFYNVDKDTTYSGETMETLHKYGKCIAAGQNIYRFNNSKWSAGVAWNLVYKGADIKSVDDLDSRLQTVETYFGAANDDQTLNRWTELVRFLDTYSDSNNISDIFVAKNAAITANTASLKFAKWDTKGLVTGAGSTAYAKTMTFNGTSYTNILRTTNADLPAFYAPTTAGTAGEVLVSNGSGAPTWQARAKKHVYMSTDKQGVSWNENGGVLTPKTELTIDDNFTTAEFAVNVYLERLVTGAKVYDEVITDVTVIPYTVNQSTRYKIVIGFGKDQGSNIFKVVVIE